MKVFVDTSAWLAFFAEIDTNHQKASQFLKKFLKEQGSVVVTSDCVFTELISTARRLVDFKGLVKIGGGVLDLTEEFLPIDGEIRRIAWRKFKNSFSKKVSFVDWTNFVLMEKNKVKNIFAFDKHFAKMGLKLLP